MTLDPPARRFKEAERRDRLKDVDAVARAQSFKALAWSLFAGLPIGAAVGVAAGHVFLGLILMPVLIWALVMGIAGMASRGARVIHMPSGSSTPRRREYSRAEALAVAGEYEAAVRAYQAAILDAPGEGEPYLRIARIYRDRLGDLEEAVGWFRRATADASLAKGEDILARREICELLAYKLGEPRRAAPELARLADRHPGTPDGRWAREELARIKEEMALEELEPPSNT